MAGSAHRCIKGTLLLAAALAAPHALAQAAYRCGAHTYSQAPCAGGRPIGLTPPHHVTDKSRPPPQDRAVAAKRAVLTPQDRHECRVLDVTLRDEQRSLRRKGEAATLDDEMPLVHAQKRYRELRC